MSRLEAVFNGLVQVIVNYNETQTQKKYLVSDLSHLDSETLKQASQKIIAEATNSYSSRANFLEYVLYVTIELKQVLELTTPLTSVQEAHIRQTLLDFIGQSKLLLTKSHAIEIDILYNKATHKMCGFSRGQMRTVTNCGQVMKSFLKDYKFPEDKIAANRMIADLIQEQQNPLSEHASDLERLSKQVERLEQTNTELTEQYQQLVGENQKAQESIQELTAAKQGLTEEVIGLRVALAKAHQQTHELTQPLQKKEIRIDSIETAKNLADVTISELRQEVSSLTSQVERLGATSGGSFLARHYGLFSRVTTLDTPSFLTDNNHSL